MTDEYPVYIKWRNIVGWLLTTCEKYPIKLIAQKIKDPGILLLCRQIISNGGNGKVGLPIGNLTSQFFANVYLTPFDHMVKEQLRVNNYLRYMDDCILFGNEISQLKQHLQKIKTFLTNNVGLDVKMAQINKCNQGIPWLGMRVYPNLLRIRRENLQRSLAKIRRRTYEYAQGYISEEHFARSLESIYGVKKAFQGTHGVFPNYKTNPVF